MRDSAGLLLFRRGRSGLEVLLAHPGGPFWSRRDHGAWTIPKGEIEPGEPPLATARREFREETGCAVDGGDFVDLGQCRQKGGKRVQAFAIEASFDPGALAGSTVAIEWPPRSGRIVSFPEIDRVEWFDLDEARTRINPAQCAFLDRLLDRVGTLG